MRKGKRQNNGPTVILLFKKDELAAFLHSRHIGGTREPDSR